MIMLKMTRLSQDEIKIRSIIGENLKLIRKKSGLTQVELAEKLDCTFQQIQKYEKARNTLSCLKLKKLSDIFNVPVERFYFPMEVTSSVQVINNIEAQI
jgi:transcriptional regulator with XRE-family HTH domain